MSTPTPAIKVLMISGNDAHKWHNWERTAPCIKKQLEQDARIHVDISCHIEDLARLTEGNYDVIALNYCNWKDPRSLADVAKNGLVKFIAGGGGALVIHFANGAFHFSLPEAGASDWPEYRHIVRRVWNHDRTRDIQSTHDTYGRFTVAITAVEHPITQGLKVFEVEDELYFNQTGDEPIELLITARSKRSGNDEPMAWTYRYGKGRVFQTLLGHSEKTYDAWEPCEMLRRATVWVVERLR